MRSLHSSFTQFMPGFLIIGTWLVPVDIAFAADWFVDASITTPGSGLLGWSDALKYLRDAITAANPQGGDVIKVRGSIAGLTYVTDRSATDPDGSCTPGPCNPTIAFVIDKQVRIEGQYTGADTTTRNPAYRTILSGRISGTENSYNVVRFEGTLDSQTRLDGFEIRYGVADGGATNPTYGRGGGVNLESSTPDVRNCVITNNIAERNATGEPGDDPPDGSGGGMFAGNGGTVTVRNCNFLENLAVWGGGFHRRINDALDEPTSHVNLLACRFISNTAYATSGQARGGGCNIDRFAGIVNVVSCEFVGNVSEGDLDPAGNNTAGGLLIGLPTRCDEAEGQCGVADCEYTCFECTESCYHPLGGGASGDCGGMCSDEETCPTRVLITNSVFVSNEARGEQSSGAGIRLNRRTTIENCTIAGNHATGVDSGGISVQHDACVILKNTIVWDNTASGSDPFAAQIGLNTSEAGLIAIASDIESCSTSLCPPASGNIQVDPEFRNLAQHNVRLKPTSDCLDVGSNAEVPLDLTDVDDDGEDNEYTPEATLRQRIWPSSGSAPTIVDMGAYEYGCDADLLFPYNNEVDGLDLGVLMGQWTGTDVPYVPCYPTRSGDLDGDCDVDGTDLATLLGAWGPCPTALTPPGGGGGGSAPQQGGGEGAAGEPPSGDECGGSYEQFIQWLGADDWEAFLQWYECASGGS